MEIEGEAEAKDQPERDEGAGNDRGIKAQENADCEKDSPDISHDQVDLHEDRVIPESSRGGFLRIMISEGVQAKEGRKKSSGKEACVNPCDRVVLKKLSGCLTHEQEGQGHHSKVSGDSPVKIAGSIPTSGQPDHKTAVKKHEASDGEEGVGALPQRCPDFKEGKGREGCDVKEDLPCFIQEPTYARQKLETTGIIFFGW